MSTFNGIVEEFPHIRVDYFRKNPDRPPPLACFLSHVHSDHLQGLESLRSPFIYCSAGTREILLRLEKYPHRMNFSKGILESRKQHYKHLAKLLRPIPLHVPTKIELKPGSEIRVTLFDANHCPGAVMFLIEGDGKSILYTGDIRAEGWWVEALIRNPVLIPYTLGTKRLDRIYLDTAFASESNIYAKFPSKAEGIRELTEKVQNYPAGTLFYLRTWTFGYEEVWLSLARALDSQIHVDRYQLGLYESLASNAKSEFGCNEGHYLCGFTLGNSHVRGCLTNQQSARIHSCEPGNICQAVSSRRAVYITPVVTRRADGSDVREDGAGGGLGDLCQTHELELHDYSSIEQLITLCSQHIPDPDARMTTVKALSEAYSSRSKLLSLDQYGIREEDEISLQRLVQMLGQGSAKPDLFDGDGDIPKGTSKSAARLPNTISFPFSRHSSYEELCLLVQAFKPKDIYPCTVDSDTWCEEVSMEHLFGDLCSSSEFLHDKMMRETISQAGSRPRKRPRRDSDSSALLSTQHSSLEIPEALANSPSFDSLPMQALPNPADKDEEARIRSQRDNVGEEIGATTSQQSLPPEFTTTASQLSFLMSESSTQSTPGTRIRAIRRALEKKAQTDKIDFYIPSSISTPSQNHIALNNGDESDQFQPKEDVAPHLSSVNVLAGSGVGDTADNDSDPDSAVSLSTSAFDSQPRVIDGADNDVASLDSLKDGDNVHDSRAGKTVRRMDAYRAVRDGSPDMWSSLYSPITAGNNHSEKDVEL